MKYNKETIQKIKKDCNVCRGSFYAWMNVLNYNKDKENNIKNHFYNHCPPCKIADKVK